MILLDHILKDIVFKWDIVYKYKYTWFKRKYGYIYNVHYINKCWYFMYYFIGNIIHSIIR